MESVNKFFSNIATTIQMWKDLPFIQILKNHYTAKEIDKLIFLDINELRRNVVELKIYFHKKKHLDYDNILKLMHQINTNLSSTYFSFEKETPINVKSNNFHSFTDQKLNEIDKILQSITEKM